MKRLPPGDMNFTLIQNFVTKKIGLQSFTEKLKSFGIEVHKGIAKRAFNRKFTLADDIEVKDAKLENGLLVIELEQIVPEHKKPRTIKVK